MVANEFREYYRSLQPNKLFLPENIHLTHFRIWAPNPIKISHILRTKKDVRDMLAHYAPLHAFYVTSYFLEPNKLGPRSETNNARFLYSDEFIIDIDSKTGYLDDDVKQDTIDLVAFMRDYFSAKPRAIVFSGMKGFHLHYPFPLLGALKTMGEGNTMALKERIAKTIINLTGIQIDEPVSKDTRRLIRIPGTIHGRSGNLVEKISEDRIKDYKPKKIIDVSKYMLDHGSAADVEMQILGRKL